VTSYEASQNAVLSSLLMFSTSTLFSDILNLCYSFIVRDQVSNPHN